MIPLVATLLLLGIILLWLGGRKRQQAGLPGGRVIYTDTQGWKPLAKPLYDPVHDLTGKPDYLVEQGKTIIPIEVKSGRTPQAPYDSHILQLAAYCLLVKRIFGNRPPYGIIKYPRRAFSIEFTPQLEKTLLDVLAEIQNYQRRRSVDRSHNIPSRCTACGFRHLCDQRL